MRAADLINNGKFNYGAFNGIPKYKQDVLIAPYKNFLERCGGFKFIFSDKASGYWMTMINKNAIVNTISTVALTVALVLIILLCVLMPFFLLIR